MVLKNISIINFKNLQQVNLDLSSKINCLIGPNGVGKTNFLDAIYYMSFCHSYNNPIDSQVISHGQPFFVLEGNYENEQGEEADVYVGMKRGTKKHFKFNKKEYRRLADHIGLIPLIMVSPADSSLISGGSEERRKLMDVVISQCDRSYMEALINYNKALQQRNSLLKMEDEPDSELLDIWEEEMAKNGEVIYRLREEFVNALLPVFQTIYRRISNDREQVSLNYVSHGQRGPLLDVIRRDRAKDRIVGFSLHGVHRDDLEMMINGFPIKKEGSQGQCKTYALALKLAQFDMLRRTVSNTTPLLLLDDIFDKLDAKRVEQIVQLVAGNTFGQIFITDTNRDYLDNILSHSGFDYKLFDVENGRIEERKNE